MKEILNLIKYYKIVKTVTAISIVAFVALMISVNVAVASGSHNHDINLTITHEYPDHDPGPLTIASDNQDSGVSNSELDKTRAMSAAGDTCVFDYAVGWQGCFGGAWAGSESAINGSLVTRVDDFMIRSNIQADTDFDDYVISVGGSWHF